MREGGREGEGAGHETYKPISWSWLWFKGDNQQPTTHFSISGGVEVLLAEHGVPGSPGGQAWRWGHWVENSPTRPRRVEEENKAESLPSRQDSEAFVTRGGLGAWPAPPAVLYSIAFKYRPPYVPPADRDCMLCVFSVHRTERWGGGDGLPWIRFTLFLCVLSVAQYLCKGYLSRDRYKNIDNLEQSCIIVFLAKANSRHLSLVGLLIKIIIQINIITNRKMKNENGWRVGAKKPSVIIMIIIIQREHKLNIKTK